MSQAAHHAEQLQIQHELEEIILKSMQEPLSADDARLIAWASGIKLETIQSNMNRKD